MSDHIANILRRIADGKQAELERQKAVLEAYLHGSDTGVEIAEKWGVTRGYAKTLAIRKGFEPRNRYRVMPRDGRVKKSRSRGS
jgi:hypothetical protein